MAGPFGTISSAPEFLDEEVPAFIEALSVSLELRDLSEGLNDDISFDEVRQAVRQLRCGAGGSDELPPVVLKALFADQLARNIHGFIELLFCVPPEE